MKERFRIITSLFLLWIFLYPTIVKIEHHHEEFLCDANGEQHFHSFHEKCAICNFEFTSFESFPGDIGLNIEQIVVDFYNKHNSPHYFTPEKYSFSLRAPPSLQT